MKGKNIKSHRDIWKNAKQAVKSAWDEEEILYRPKTSSQFSSQQSDFREEYYEAEFYEDNIYDEPEYLQPYVRNSASGYGNREQI